MISFRLYCPTEYGQNLFVKCDDELYPMSYDNGGYWALDIEMRIRKPKIYSYILQYADGSQEIDTPKYRYIPVHQDDIILEDTFSHRNLNTIYQAKAYIECLTKPFHYHHFPGLKRDEAAVLVFAPGVRPDQGVAVCGEEQYVGAWNPEHMVKFVPTVHGWWWLKLPTVLFKERAEYKFVIYDRATSKVIQWEDGENRKLPIMCAGKMLTTTLRIKYNWRGSGVAIPVFSLRTADSWGVGEFYDLKKMGDWAVANGHKLIQILPINDTTATHTASDSYPYSANSVHALHPMYLHIPSIGELKDKKQTRLFVARAKHLNELPEVDYVAVNNLKWDYLTQYYEENYNDIVYGKEFKTFVKENDAWIKDYAVFSCIREKYKNDNFHEWNEGADYSVALRDKYIKFHKFGVSLYYFAQYQLHLQLKETVEYLHSIGVVLKGDLPIGVNAHSVDTWVSPKLFNLDSSAGAPPDAFSEKGQNWGFPTYNWAEMSKDKFAWWKSRFINMDRYFDAFRVDHILGFFRIWEIPNDSVWGLLGHFNPALPLSIEEINNYGLKFDVDRFTKPYVTKERLISLFADETYSVTSRFFNQVKDNVYTFKAVYKTQRSLVDLFERHKAWSDKKDILEKLLELSCEVLFIEDNRKRGLYHPRINLMNTESFKALPDEEKVVLRKIHNEFFYERHNVYWKKEAWNKFPFLINCTDMLICAEDLGMVPQCVPEVLKQLQVLSLEVQRMPKSDDRYIDVTKTPYLSVCTTGTHDTSTLRSWWRENRENTQWYYNNVLNREGEAPKELTGLLARTIVDMHLNSSSIWTILPWQDYMACDEKKRLADPDAERINNPDNPDQVWSWRMHIELK